MGLDKKIELTYGIGEVSQQVGLSQKRIREYEQGGLIRPRREPRTNNRFYTQADIRQIERIRTLIHEHGFTVACLRYFLTAAPCWIVFDCKEKDSCPSYRSPHAACYELMKKVVNDDGTVKCSQCPIYLNRDQQQMTLFEKP